MSGTQRDTALSDVVSYDDGANGTADGAARVKAASAAAGGEQEKKCAGCSIGICKKIRVGLLAVLLIVVMTLQVVSFKKAGYSYGPYPYMILITVGLAFIPICFTIVGIIHCRSGGFVSEITSCRYKAHYSVIGLFNALNGILIIFSNPHVSGVLQSILAQAVIPFTLILSLVWLRTRYAPLQYVGAIIVIGGVVVSLIPVLEGPAASNGTTNASAVSLFAGDDIGAGYGADSTVFGDDESGDDGASGGGGLLATLGDAASNQAVIWAIVFTLGQLPQALMSIYQEKVFAEAAAEVNVFYMMAWAMLAQFVVLAAAFPINFVPWFGAISADEAGAYVTNATLCLFHLPGSAPQCEFALLDLSLCVLTMLGTNVVQAFLVKYSSAVLMMFIITLVTPVSAFAFTFRFLMGDDVETVNLLEVVALLVLMAGICIYRYKAILALFKRKPTAAEAAAAAAAAAGKRASGGYGTSGLAEPLVQGGEPARADGNDDGLGSVHEVMNTRASLLTTDFVGGSTSMFSRGTQRARSRSTGARPRDTRAAAAVADPESPVVVDGVAAGSGGEEMADPGAGRAVSV